jgi:tripartite-type tricarboxylate transporter receptor subunit TctC
MTQHCETCPDTRSFTLASRLLQRWSVCRLTVLMRWLLALSALALVGASAAAEVYPSRPIRLIVPYSTGGPTDTAARLMAEALGRQLGQPVTVENRTGAGGLIGTEAALHALPDGYTLLVSAAATFTVIPAVKKVGFDPEKDFVPLGQIWSASTTLVVNSHSSIKTVAELVAYAKANPNKMTFGSAGNGTTTHLSIGMLSREADIKVIHVPYRSTSNSMVDLLGGQIDAIMGDPATVAPQVKSGKLTALAVLGPERSSLLPNVPTMAEAGLPGVRTVNWYGLHALAGTPPAVLDRLKAAVLAAQQDPAYKTALANIGNSTGTVGAKAFAEMIHEEIARLTPVVRSMGITFK